MSLHPPSAERIGANIDVLLGVTASVAAYKAAEIARLLRQRQLNVQVVMTRRAKRFLGSETLSAITGNAVLSDLFGAGPGELHVELSARSRRMLIAPATADALARLAHGRANDLLMATATCFRGPLHVAPAMHPRMWTQAATSYNVALLQERGVDFLGPEFGPVASGDVGLGRLLEPAQIVERLLAGPIGDLVGKRLIVSAGPTLEDIDPVRFIGNRSSGKMGFALARRAAARGAEVDLVTGPVQLQTPLGVRRHDIRSALELQRALDVQLQRPADALIMAAAVGDFRAQQTLPDKLKRSGDWTLSLVQNPDIIAALADHPAAGAVTRVAFAVETGQDSEIIDRAQGKLRAKRVHAVVANRAEDALGRDDNRAHWISEHALRSFPTLSKHDLADAILDCLLQRWQYTRP